MADHAPDSPVAPLGATTPLDPPESAVAEDSCSSWAADQSTRFRLLDSFRHSGWRQIRERIWLALAEANQPVHRRVNFGRCGSSWWVQQHRTDPGRFRIVLDRCHDRFCTPCAVDRRAVIRRNLAGKLLPAPHRLLTLTIRHHDEPLRELINHLMRSFRRLRQRSLWRERVTGGAAILEVKLSADGTSWHPHLHVILEGRYLPSPQLREIWLAVTGDSHNLDISLIRQPSRVIDYVCKYVTKPLSHTITHHHRRLTEAIRALAHRRLLVTFGRWRHWHLTSPPDDRSWTLYGHVDEIHYKALDGDLLAHRVESMLHTADPRTGEFWVDLDLPPPYD